MTQINDTLNAFVFENLPIRGSHVQLNQTFQQALAHQTLPLVIKNAIGELMAAAALLSASIKMQGALVLQIQSKQALKLLVVECDDQLNTRATAHWQGEINAQTFIELIAGGLFVLTLAPKVGEPYQGIVPIEGDNIAEMLEHYMRHSQQIETTLILSSEGEQAAGMLLQKLPEKTVEETDDWARVQHLAHTLTVSELQNLTTETLLHRLFSEDDMRLFEAKNVQFSCGCTRQKVANMLQLLGEDEIKSMLAETPNIQVNCDFCQKAYAFDAVDAMAALQASQTESPAQTH